MNVLKQPFEEMGEFSGILGLLKKRGKAVSISGCVDSQKMHMAYGLSDGFRNKIIVTYSDIRAREIYEDYKFYDRNTAIYPGKDLIFYQADIHGNRLTTERMKVLRRIMEGVPVTIVTTFDSLMAYQISLERLKGGHPDSQYRSALYFSAGGKKRRYQVPADRCGPHRYF